MLRKNCVPSELVIQGILAFAYGYLVDFSMLILKRLEIGSYIGQILFLGKLEGVREGTVIAAFIVGIFIKYCQKIFGPVMAKLIPEEADV